jgi:hypothetical protein
MLCCYRTTFDYIAKELGMELSRYPAPQFEISNSRFRTLQWLRLPNFIGAVV